MSPTISPVGPTSCASEKPAGADSSSSGIVTRKSSVPIPFFPEDVVTATSYATVGASAAMVMLATSSLAD
jgi:hypothetical protein